MLNIARQWQDPEILIVFRVYYEKLGHMLKNPMSKFCSDLSIRLSDIAEKQVPAELKPIEAHHDKRRSGPELVHPK